MSYSLFPRQKMTAKKCKTWQSNIPSIETNVRRLQNNQPESYTSVRWRNANKKEMKKQVFSKLPLLQLLNKWKIIKKTIKWTWLSWIKSIRSKERMAYSLEEDKEKGTKQREDREWSLYPPAFTYLSIMVVFCVQLIRMLYSGKLSHSFHWCAPGFFYHQAMYFAVESTWFPTNEGRLHGKPLLFPTADL